MTNGAFSAQNDSTSRFGHSYLHLISAYNIDCYKWLWMKILGEQLDQFHPFKHLKCQCKVHTLGYARLQCCSMERLVLRKWCIIC